MSPSQILCENPNCKECNQARTEFNAIAGKELQRQIDREIVLGLMKQMEQENDTLEWLLDE